MRSTLSLEHDDGASCAKFLIRGYGDCRLLVEGGEDVLRGVPEPGPVRTAVDLAERLTRSSARAVEICCFDVTLNVEVVEVAVRLSQDLPFDVRSVRR